ncbi:hypothetical protein BSZ19_24765 [Bradyrhizobium japonicum]|uniref:Uncharacterized protein n=1 Tax=Bradyrhizobium japonicum TaxID=375 RepID=A0A1Y2JNJ7_BRAJP|nr:hypothetical protein BSZ19_24765 [Bradyrhizobium japonicum]
MFAAILRQRVVVGTALLAAAKNRGRIVVIEVSSEYMDHLSARRSSSFPFSIFSFSLPSDDERTPMRSASKIGAPIQDIVRAIVDERQCASGAGG